MPQPLAYINPEAKIAEGVIIEPFATIQKNVEIGEGTWIGPNAVIMDGARIGKNCKIFPGAVISAIPQDLKFIGEETTAVIGDNTTIRECVTINRGTQANWETRVGNNCLIMAYAHLGHDSVVGNNCILANNASLSGHVMVDDWAILNGFTAVQQFIHIGSHTYIAGGTLVRKDIPPFTKAAREPISYVGINSVGLQRRKYTEEQIIAIQEIYRYIYLKNFNVQNALDLIEKELPQTPERDEILSFIRNSKNGIMRGSGGETD
jgi:UDP-N-acetylglucosamine acyltransferase